MRHSVRVPDVWRGRCLTAEAGPPTVVAPGYHKSNQRYTRPEHRRNQLTRSDEDNYYYYYNHLTASFPGLPGWAGTRKVKPIWILLEQETVSGSGISWAICKSAPRSRQITTPAPRHSDFLQAGCPSCRPTNSVKALSKGEQCKL